MENGEDAVLLRRKKRKRKHQVTALTVVAVLIVGVAAFAVVYSIVVLAREEMLNSFPDIDKHKDDVNAIITYMQSGPGKHQTWKRLANFTDMFGSRMTGSLALEQSIDFLVETLTAEGFDKVYTEEVTVPYWVRGEESVTLLSPRKVQLRILGVGGSIATPQEGITGDALVVRSFEELEKRSSEAKGKIVVFNPAWLGRYSRTSGYRVNGASVAAQHGAIAVLIRSITPFSIDTPHTGWQVYKENVTKIPAASITVEDAEMLNRMADNGEVVTIEIRMSSHPNGTTQSRHTIAEITGSKYPEQIVLVSGHLDSWDVGVGAMDDGGGSFISWQALTVIKSLGYRPKRTVRLILWTAEEQGVAGSGIYFERHKDEAGNMSVAMESDDGTFKPVGIGFSGSNEAVRMMQSIASMLAVVNADEVEVGKGVSPDTGKWVNIGVPGLALDLGNGDNIEKPIYFYFHHTEGDRMEVEDPDDLDLCAIIWTVYAYIIADLENMLPR